MDSLETYLRSEYLDDRQEIERIQELINQVLPVFQDFFIADSTGDEGRWGYQVIDHRHPQVTEITAASGPGSKYSLLTNGQILFALAAIVGCVEASPLIPRTRLPFTIRYDSSLPDIFSRGLRRLYRQLVLDNFETTSPTFGANDPFTLAWILELVKYLAFSPSPPPWLSTAKVPPAQALDTLAARAHKQLSDAESRPAEPLLTYPTSLSNPLEHSFPLLRLVHANELLKNVGRPASVGLTKLARYFADRVHLHLSYSAVPESAFDAAELAFSLEGLLLCDPDARDEDTLRRVFQVIADRQTLNPYWRPNRPMVRTPQGQVVFPLSVEIANALLRLCNRVDADDVRESYFSSHVQLFKRYAAWLRSTLVTGEADTFQASSRRVRFVGWHSEYIDAPSTIDLWQTSQMLLFLVHYAAMLHSHLARTALFHAKFSLKRPNRANHTSEPYWDTAEATYEPLKSLPKHSPYAVFHRIGNNYVAPRAPSACTHGAGDCHYSMLLYGPPGTGKTAAAEELAKALAFRLIEITPSDFVARGEAEVEARAKSIFLTLREQTDVVILFDEIDRLILDRDSKLYQRQSDVFQFMTPGMLTKFKDLRSQKRSIFVIATNYAERIDAAAKRSGRLDDGYLLLPPDATGRLAILKERISHHVKPKPAPADHEWAPSLADTVKQTPLWVFGEFDQLIRDALATRPDTTRSNWLTQTGAILAAAASKLKPTTTLSSYRSRFKATAEVPTDFLTMQEPLEEFLLLVWLSVEEGQELPPDDLELVKTLVAKTGPYEILKEVRDEQVRDSLLIRFRTWGVAK